MATIRDAIRRGSAMMRELMTFAGENRMMFLSARPFYMTEYDATNFTSEHPIPEGDGVIFRVDDDGPGIDPNILSRLFDPYVSSKSVGRGLGLATVRTIVEAHGGGIRVESALDRGTTFLIFLPASKLPKADMGVPRVRPAEEAVPGDVLLVDNDESVLKTTAILLKAIHRYDAFLAKPYTIAELKQVMSKC